MSGTSKAVLSICVLLLAGLVVYYGMGPVDSPNLTVGDIPSRNPNTVKLFGRNLDAATAALGIPSPIVEISNEPANLINQVVKIEKVEPMPALQPAVEEQVSEVELVFYTVVSGDTLGEIAHKLMGSAIYASQIADLNDIDNPRTIQLGRRLQIPGISFSKQSPLNTALPSTAMMHVIQDGETLSDIAQDYLGSPHMWIDVWNANKSRITNPDRLKVGVSIVIP